MAKGRGCVAEGAVFRSDRGFRCASKLLAAWVAANDVRLPVGQTGGCRDNAVAESLFGTPKSEMCSLRPWPTRAEARRAAVGYIEGYYNRRRPHSTIGYQTLADKMEAFFEKTGDAPRGCRSPCDPYRIRV